MIEITKKRKGVIAQEQAMYKRDIMLLPQCSTRTSRDVPFLEQSPSIRSSRKRQEEWHYKVDETDTTLGIESRVSRFSFACLSKEHLPRENEATSRSVLVAQTQPKEAQKKRLEEAKQMKEEWNQAQFDVGISDK